MHRLPALQKPPKNLAKPAIQGRLPLLGSSLLLPGPLGSASLLSKSWAPVCWLPARARSCVNTCPHRPCLPPRESSPHASWAPAMSWEISVTSPGHCGSMQHPFHGARWERGQLFCTHTSQVRKLGA